MRAARPIIHSPTFEPIDGDMRCPNVGVLSFFFFFQIADSHRLPIEQYYIEMIANRDLQKTDCYGHICPKHTP